MMLVDNQILDRVQHCEKYLEYYSWGNPKPLIEPFDEMKLQSSSYDLSISNIIRVYKNDIGVIDLKNDKSLDKNFEEIKIDDKGYCLKPGEYILVKLVENINMSSDLMAMVVPRTTMNRIGLGLRLQYINPSYSGNMFLGLKNNASIPIKIYEGTVIGQVCFFKLDGKPDLENLYVNKVEQSYQDEDEFRIVSDEVKNLVNETLLKMLKDK